jgi:hypothetical protein
MKVIPLVKDEEAALARKMERRILMLPEESGILFASVTVLPAVEAEPPVYDVLVGGKPEFDEGVLVMTAEMALALEISGGARVRVQSRRGLVRQLAHLPPRS